MFYGRVVFVLGIDVPFASKGAETKRNKEDDVMRYSYSLRSCMSRYGKKCSDVILRDDLDRVL